MFYGLAGLGLLVSFSNVMREVANSGSDPNGAAGLAGYMVGSFLVPALLFWAGSSCMKKSEGTE